MNEDERVEMRALLEIPVIRLLVERLVDDLNQVVDEFLAAEVEMLLADIGAAS